MKIIIPKTEIEAQDQFMHDGYKLAMLDPKHGKDDGNGNIVMELAMFDRIRVPYTPREGTKPLRLPVMTMAFTPWNPQNAEKIIAARHATCYGDGTQPKCDWNVDDLCQHPACKTCPGKQKAAGALKAMIKQPSAICGANKWKFKI